MKIFGGLTNIFTQLWLVTWYVVAIYLTVLTLGITQYNSGKKILSDSGKIPFAEMEALEAQEKSAVDRLMGAELALYNQQEKISGIRTERFNLKEKLIETQTLANTESDPDKKAGFLRDASIIEDRIALLDSLLADIHAEQKDASLELEEIQTKSSEHQVALREFHRLQDERNHLEGAYPLASSFFKLPQEMLTIILTLAMGVFGSTIAVSRDYLKDGGLESRALDKRVAWFFFRPMQGAVMALSIFILFKAGVLVFVTPTASDQAASELNPFVIAFLGVISGLFAENAYARLYRSSETLFSDTDNTPPPAELWAHSRINSLMAEQDKTLEALAELTEQTETEVSAWLSGESQTPANFAEKISRWLNSEIDELFYHKPGAS